MTESPHNPNPRSMLDEGIAECGGVGMGWDGEGGDRVSRAMESFSTEARTGDIVALRSRELVDHPAVQRVSSKNHCILHYELLKRHCLVCAQVLHLSSSYPCLVRLDLRLSFSSTHNSS